MCALGLRSPVENDEALSRPRPAAWRWRRRALQGGVALLLLALAAPFVIAQGLDSPWLKGRVRAFVRRSAGVEVDYRTLTLRWLSGVTIEDLVVRSPAEVQAFAPELLRAGKVEASWSTSSLLGSGPKVERVLLEDLALTIVIDEHGRTSIDAIPSEGPPPPPKPPVPLSRMAAEQLAAAPPVGRADLARVAVRVVRTDHQQVVERDDLDGLDAALAFAPADHGERGWKAHLQAGAPDAPLALAVKRAPVGAAPAEGKARLALIADVSNASLDASLDLRVDQQSFVPQLGADARLAGQEWLRVDAGAKFDPDHGMTSIALRHAEAAGGAATAEASIDLPDTGDPVVHSARGDLDGVRLLAWAPAGLVPVTASRATVHYQVDALVAGAVPRFADGGGLTADAEVADAEVRLPDQVIDVGRAKLSAHGVPAADGGVVAKGNVQVGSARLDSSADTLAAGDLALDFDGRRAADGAIDGHATLRFGKVAKDAKRVTGAVAARDGRLDVTLTGVRPNGAELAASRGQASLSGGAGEFSLRSPSGAVDVEGLTVEARADSTKAVDAADYTLQASVGTFAQTPAAPASPVKASAIQLRSAGHVEGWLRGEPSIKHDTRLAAEGLDLGQVTARSLLLALQSEGGATRHKGHADLQTTGLSFERGEASDDHVTLDAAIDRSQPSLHVELGTEGRVASKLTASVSFDRARRALMYDVDGRAAGFAPLAPLLSAAPGLLAFDLSALELTVAARGALLGVVSRVTGDGELAFEPKPLHTALVEGTVDVRADKFRWSHGDTAIESPSVAWRATFGGAVGRRTLDAQIDSPALHLGLGPHQIDLGGISDSSSVVVTGDLVDPELALKQDLAVKDVRQDYTRAYPVGDFDLSVAVSRDPNGIFHVSEMTMHNGAGGTDLQMTGGVDLGAGRRRMSINAEVDQNLAPLAVDPKRFDGAGKVHFTASVESADMAVYRTRLDLKAADVRVRLPGAGLEIDALNGEIPVTAAFDVGKDGVSLRRSLRLNPYSILRFADQHPLLARSGYISASRLKTPYGVIAPLVGNLEVDQNVVSLRQFEMGMRGGSVTGECALDWEGKKSTVELHVRANGVQSSHGEPFDGNIAVSFAAADRSIEGRAEVLRIGPQHLLDLIDMQDPTRANPALNRVRGLLPFGYPKHLRLTFDHGFAAAKLELGGIASIVTINELRGLPMGPLIDKFLSPALDKEEEP